MLGMLVSILSSSRQILDQSKNVKKAGRIEEHKEDKERES